jgi:ubiquinone/menaquinone biosynthesis C-methylase UbiE
MNRVLSHDEARTFYDRFGAKQDLQRFYEDPAIKVLLAHADFANANAIVELGSGTGRLAAHLLRDVLPPRARYVGFDISQTMANLAENRLRRWSDRAQVRLTEGSPELPLEDASCDRFLATYVLDLLSEPDIRAVLAEARRVLVPGGRLCLASLTFGNSPASRLVCRVWTALHSVRPRMVGGCRPLHLGAFLDESWRVVHEETLCAFGICTEVLVAC